MERILAINDAMIAATILQSHDRVLG